MIWLSFFAKLLSQNYNISCTNDVLKSKHDCRGTVVLAGIIPIKFDFPSLGDLLDTSHEVSIEGVPITILVPKLSEHIPEIGTRILVCPSPPNKRILP